MVHRKKRTVRAQHIKRLDQLTGLRFFAALLVFFSHIEFGLNSFFSRLFKEGYVGVSFFFVLSGFILSYSYAEKVRNKKISPHKFILLRLARLTPLHFATAALFIFLAIQGGYFDITKTVLNLAYLQSWVPNNSFYFSLNAPSWSLSDEMFFYFCFFPIVFLTVKNRARLTLALGTVVMASAAVVTVEFSGEIVGGGYKYSSALDVCYFPRI